MAKKQLSNFDSMWNEYPLGEAAAIKKRIGGNVDADWIANTCVVRVSRAFNYSGHPIPNGRSSLVTVKGGDRLRYAFRVAEFFLTPKTWMFTRRRRLLPRRLFPMPERHRAVGWPCRAGRKRVFAR